MTGTPAGWFIGALIVVAIAAVLYVGYRMLWPRVKADMKEVADDLKKKG